MRIEHIAYPVEDPADVAAWYVKHLGFEIKRAHGEGARAHFLADSSGQVMIEIYNNPRVDVPNYPTMDPLLLHVAFASEDPAGDRDRLVEAGCTVFEEIAGGPDDDHLVMLRDPWGLPIQLCRRARPMV